jgi:hypothetical protein
MLCSTIVDERQHHARRRSRLDLSNGMRLAPLATVADDLRTMLRSGLATVALRTPRARTNDLSVMMALPFTLYRSSTIVASRTPGAVMGLGCSDLDEVGGGQAAEGQLRQATARG